MLMCVEILDSYIQTKPDSRSGIRQVGICVAVKGDDDGLCDSLAKTAITTVTIAVLFLIALFACLMARPSLDPRRIQAQAK